MLGKILQDYGKIFENDKLKVVHMHLKADDKIPAHNHPEDIAFFTVNSGKMEVQLDERESYIVEAKQSLNFDGINSISAKALEESDIFVFLLRK